MENATLDSFRCSLVFCFLMDSCRRMRVIFLSGTNQGSLLQVQRHRISWSSLRVWQMTTALLPIVKTSLSWGFRVLYVNQRGSSLFSVKRIICFLHPLPSLSGMPSTWWATCLSCLRTSSFNDVTAVDRHNVTAYCGCQRLPIIFKTLALWRWSH